ncbi:MAG: helix-turn-helix transcriptional regulator [Loktanella sp.]|jgi:DNA-binding CsgD family transcriptional regulator|nr:helix-turn-helix transcriptional regulator [Loktanella sp.]
MLNRRILTKYTVLRLVVLVILQSLCAAFFVVELLTEVLGLRHWAVSWATREFLQIGASVGLVLGAVASVALLRQTLRRLDKVEQQVEVASGLFADVLHDQFLAWDLSPAEREVALFAVRGYSNSEIAKARGKSEATIKSQLNAIFRKAEVAGRTALVCHFIDVVLENISDQSENGPRHQDSAGG